MNYLIKNCNNFDEWNGYLKQSKQNNIFSSHVIKSDFGLYDSYLLFRKEVFLIGCIIQKNNSNKPKYIYQNFFYSNYFDNLNSSKSVKLKIESTEIILNKLYEKYDKIEISLHHTITDIRPFQWFNFNDKNKPNFKIKINYTGLSDLNSKKNFNDYLSNIRASRRQDYKKAQDNNFQTFEEHNSNNINSLLVQTFERQNILKNSLKQINASKNIINDSIKNKYGRLLISYSEDNKPASGSLFLFDKDCAYYYVGATNPAYRSFGVGTQVIIDQMKYFFQKNIKKFDFIGINSPNRGDFKTSFNAEPTIYFDLFLKK